MPNRDYEEERREYEYSELNRENIHIDPFLQFQDWMDAAHAAKIMDPTAVSVSTVDANYQPHSRVVLLKSFDENGFVFYTNYESAKGHDIEQNPKAAMLFFWPEMDRQIRIEGDLVKISRTQSEAYFSSRPFDSQIAAISSKQSQVVSGRKTIEQNFEIALANNPTLPTCPDHWGGYQLIPNSFEFWQGRSNRLHDRFKFTKIDKNSQAWTLDRLSP